MKVRTMLLTLCVLLLPLFSFASQPCVSGTLQDYIALGTTGCTFDGVTFANFSYQATTPGVSAKNVQVVLFSPTSTDPELKFMGMWRAAGGETLQAVIKYTVQMPATGSSRQPLLQLLLGPTAASGTVGSGEVDEATNVGNLSVFVKRNGSSFQFKRIAFLHFSPPSALKTVENKVTVMGGDKGTTLTYFFNTFNSNPAF